MGGARTPSQQFSITDYHSFLSIESPTSLSPSAHEIKKLISFLQHSMYLDSVCTGQSVFDLTQNEVVQNDVTEVMDQMDRFDQCKSFGGHQFKDMVSSELLM